jgi:glutathione synthase
MKLAFIVDPLDGLRAYKDTSIAMMRAAAARGHAIWAMQREALFWRDGLTQARARQVTPAADERHWYVAGEERVAALRDFDAVLMRQDPPFDFEYTTATWLLERAEALPSRKSKETKLA